MGEAKGEEKNQQTVWTQKVDLGPREYTERDNDVLQGGPRTLLSKQ